MVSVTSRKCSCQIISPAKIYEILKRNNICKCQHNVTVRWLTFRNTKSVVSRSQMRPSQKIQWFKPFLSCTLLAEFSQISFPARNLFQIFAPFNIISEPTVSHFYCSFHSKTPLSFLFFDICVT